MNKPGRTPTWAFILPATLILIGLGVGTFDFAIRWHRRGDTFAQAEGALLTFISASFSILVTLAFIYLTRRSLEAAQDAIQLQERSLAATERLIDLERDSLVSAREAIDLQREQWNRQLDVQPRFWVQLSGDNESGIQFVYASDQPGHNPPGSIPQVMCYVWNPGQQSFRVVCIKLWSAGDRSISSFLEVPDTVVAPHTVAGIDITAKLPRILFRDLRIGGPYQRDAFVKPYEVITASLVIDSWKNDKEQPQPIEAHFRIQTDHGLDRICIQAQQTPLI